MKEKDMYWSPKKIFLILIVCFLSSGLTWLALIRHVQPVVTTGEDEYCKKTNDGQLSEKWSHNPELDLEDDRKFHVVTNIVLVTHKAYSANLLYNDERPPSINELEDRQREIENSLQSNLNNPLVAAVHVLYFHPAVSKYLWHLKLRNSKKLVLHLTRRDATVGVNLDYIQKYLKNKFVILMNQDNILGEGWEDIDQGKLRRQRMMYALTRHAITEKYPCNAATTASCNPGSLYLGSHDTFVFYADKPFPREMLKGLDIVPNSAGMENVLIWYFRNKLKYRVLNPCLKLKVYHNHCIPIRNKRKKRYNVKGKNGLAPFTHELF